MPLTLRSANFVKLLKLTLTTIIASYCTLGFGGDKNTNTVLGNCNIDNNGILTITATNIDAISNIFDLNDPPVDNPQDDNAAFIALDNINGIKINSDFVTSGDIGLEITKVADNHNGQSTELTLANNIVIEPNVTIHGNKSAFEINNSNIIINADIENNGTIKGGVVLGEYPKLAFPLRSVDTTGTTRFINKNIVHGGFNIKGTKSDNGNSTDTFELINNSATAANAEITGDINFESINDPLNFKLTNNQGTIEADNITATEIINSGDINKTTNGKAIKARNTITNSGEIGNSNMALTITSPLITNNFGGIINARFKNDKKNTTINNKGGTIVTDSIEVTTLDNNGTINETTTTQITAFKSITNSTIIGKNSNNLTITSPLITNNPNGIINAKFENATSDTTINNLGGAIESAKIAVTTINNNQGTITADFDLPTQGNDKTAKITNASAAAIVSTNIKVTEIDNSGMIDKNSSGLTITANKITNSNGGHITADKISKEDLQENIINNGNGSVITASNISATNIDNSGIINADANVNSIITASNITNNEIIAQGETELTITSSMIINNPHGKIGTADKPIKNITATTQIDNNHEIYADSINSINLTIINNEHATITANAITANRIDNDGAINLTAGDKTITAATINNNANGTIKAKFSDNNTTLTNDGGNIESDEINATTVYNKQGTIKAKFANDNTTITNGVLNSVNEAIIAITADHNAPAMAVQNYSGEDNSELCLVFNDINALANLQASIVDIKGTMEFKNNSIISLCGNNATKLTTAEQTKVNLIACADITLDVDSTAAIVINESNIKDLDNIIFTKVFTPSGKSKKYAIIAEEITYLDNIVTANLTLVKAPSSIIKQKAALVSEVITAINTTKITAAQDNLGACSFNADNDLTVKPETANNTCYLNLDSLPANDDGPICDADTITKLEIEDDPTAPSSGFDFKIKNNTQSPKKVLNLTDGLVIHDGATINNGFAINDDNTIINADIENHGTIKNGVNIGKSAGDELPLRVADASNNNTTAKFTNFGEIAGGVSINGIEADADDNLTPQANAATAFELINGDGTTASNITGDIILNTDTDNALTCNLINKEKSSIEADNISVNKIDNSGIIKSNFSIPANESAVTTIINKAIIEITAGKTTAMEVTDYTGENDAELHILFSDLSKLTSDVAIINIKGTMEFHQNCKIVLCGSDSSTTEKKNVPLIKSPTVDIDQQEKDEMVQLLNTLIYSKAFDGNIIKATAINYDDTTVTVDLKIIETAETTNAIVANKDITEYQPYIAQDFVSTTESSEYKLVPIQHEIAKQAVASLPTHIANVHVGDLAAEIQNEDYYQQELKKHSNPNAFADAILPDTSNAQVTASSHIANKLADNISSHAIGKIGSGSRRIRKLGVSSGDLTEEVSVWAGFNYILSLEDTNDKKHDYSHTQGFLFNLGADGKLENDITLGLSYGYSRVNTKVKGGLASKDKATNKIDYHSIALYSATGFDDVDTSFSAYYSYVNNSGEDLTSKIDDYSTNIFGANSAAVYSLFSYANTNIDIINNIGGSIIMVGEHTNKYGKNKTKKTTHKLLNAGIGCAIKKTISFSEKNQFSYNLAGIYKFTHAVGDKKTIVEVTKNHSVAIIPRVPVAHKLHIDALFDLELDKQLNFELDLNLALGLNQNLLEFGTSLVVRYIF